MRITRYRAALGCLLLIVLAFYMWTAASSIGFDFSAKDNDLYNELTTAFLHGHPYLPIKPPAGLLHLKNPYDPAQNAPYNAAYHDLSLYKGRFYTQWGPTPVVTLFAPFCLTGLRMSPSFAVALFGFIGLLCAVWLLHLLAARLVPRAPRWLLLTASGGLALTNTVPFLLRRPAFYEVAISSGYCFAMAGLLLVCAAVLRPRVGRVRMAFGSLCLGLAVGGRPPLVVGCVAAAAAALWAIRRREEGYGLLACAVGPIAVCGVLLAAYNEVRFGGLTNFGQSYELAGIDQMKLPFFQFSSIPAGLFSYLLIPARLALTFPHAFLMTASSDPFPLPHGYIGGSAAAAAEPAGGVFPTMPISLLLAALPGLWLQRRAGERGALSAITGLLGLGTVIALLLALVLNGTTERYEVDFGTLFLVPAFLTWGLLVGRQRPGSAGRRALAIAGVLLTLFGAAVGVAISITGYYDFLRLNHPAVFSSLEDVTAPFATLATIIVGRPEIARVGSGAVPVTLPAVTYGTATENHASAWLGTTPLTLTVISPGSRRMGLTALALRGIGAPPLSKAVIRVSSNGRPAIVPVISPSVRLPVSLHTGLNRVRLTLLGAPTLAEEVLLHNLILSP